MMIEKNRRAYWINEEFGERSILTLIETSDGWQQLAFGSQYNHWYEIGERGGLAEAGELKISGRLNTNIETYIEIYRHLFRSIGANTLLFEEFEIEGTILLNNSVTGFERKRRESVIKEYCFELQKNQIYKKKITIFDLPIFKAGCVLFSYIPRKEIPYIKITKDNQQLALF